MSRPIPTRAQAIADLKRRCADDPDPRLSILEVSVLMDFHRRTLQRYVDEKVLKAERIGPRIFVRWTEVCDLFREDARRIKAKMAKLDT